MEREPVPRQRIRKRNDRLLFFQKTIICTDVENFGASIEIARVQCVGIAPCSVELYEAVVAVNDVKRPSQFGQERDCWSPFRSERPARPAPQQIACRL